MKGRPPIDDGDAEVIAAIQARPPYRAIDRAFVARVLTFVSRPGMKAEDRLRAARARLHQTVGAYRGSARILEDAIVAIEDAARANDPSAVDAACRAAMRWHASTRERLPTIDTFLTWALPAGERVGSIVDVGCGLNPLWLGLRPRRGGPRYRAIEVDDAIGRAVARVLTALGVDATISGEDVTAPNWSVGPEIDVLLLMKVLPNLEQVESGAGTRVLRANRARRTIVTFPGRSLGGSAKGMFRTYDAWFRRAAEGMDGSIETRTIGEELCFRIDAPTREGG